MKYNFTYLPNTEKARNFKVRSTDGSGEGIFQISREMIDIWGNPHENLLREFIVAHIRKNGWPKSPVTINPEDYARSLNQAVAELNAAAKK